MKSKSFGKQKNENILKNNLHKERFPSLKINVNPQLDFKNKYKKIHSTKNSFNFPYPYYKAQNPVQVSFLVYLLCHYDFY